MTINSFFVLLMVLLGAIFFLYRPMQMSVAEHMEVAQIDLNGFSVYEIDQQGVKTVLSGSNGWRYTNRYEVNDVNFTDNTKRYKQVMIADFGRYQDDVIDLFGNVRFEREDGLAFIAGESTYDQRSSVARTKGEFKILQNSDWISGSALTYNSEAGTVSANDIKAGYTIRKNGD